ncbi:MAG TPA: response regulator transcription factor [Terracidiphilus sp.]|nr:response regulator transcription factor [Terracidiphilus sp.]
MEDVLLIDDDVELCSMLIEYLGKNGFRVHAVYRGDAGLKRAREQNWAMILLDVMLPGMDGFEVLKQIRTASTVSVLLLTARGEDVDRIVGLEIGADDYLPKPFNPRELLARMRAVLRRSNAAAGDEQGILRVQNLELDPAARKVLQDGTRIDLTDVEFALLEALMRSPGKVVSREDLSESVLGRKFDPFDRSLDMHVSRLRRKLDTGASQEERVKTIRGSGYQLAVDRSQARQEG